MFKDLKCSELGSDTYAEMNQIFLSSFDVDPKSDLLRHFVHKMDRVLLMYEAGEPVAFMFFSFKSINGMRLLNPGLTGKKGSTKNVLKILGSYIVVKYFLLNPLWLTQRCGAIIVANNPRSYLTLADAGIPIYPDIYRPEMTLGDNSLYREALEVMKLEGVNEKGLLPNSLTRIGLGMKAKEVNYDLMNEQGRLYMDYVERDPENALVALAIGRPLFAAPPYYLKLAAKTLKRKLTARTTGITGPIQTLLPGNESLTG